MNSSPLVSVVMPVYNAEKYLPAAIESILNQTFSDFEFLILNDGSTDNSAAIISRYRDSRIRLIQAAENQGLIAQLNQGLHLARGRYIARMDADDISLKNRLEKQVKFLEAHPEVGILGAAISHLGPAGITYTETFPLTHPRIQSFLLLDTPFAHPVVMLRRAVLLENHLHYHPAYPAAEDYKLWLDMLQVTQGANLPEPLLYYRDSGTQVSKQHHALQISNAQKTRQEAFNQLGLALTPAQFKFHNYLWYQNWEPNAAFFTQATSWYTTLFNLNTTTRRLPPAALGYTLGLFLFRQCWQHASVNFNAYKIYRNSVFYTYYRPSRAQLVKLMVSPYYRHVTYYFRTRGAHYKQKLKKIFS